MGVHFGKFIDINARVDKFEMTIETLALHSVLAMLASETGISSLWFADEDSKWRDVREFREELEKAIRKLKHRRQHFYKLVGREYVDGFTIIMMKLVLYSRSEESVLFRVSRNKDTVASVK